jgi:uncharacterized protein (DUF2336 family)
MIEQQDLLFELEEARASGSAPRWAEMLRRATDLFVNGAVHLSAERIALFDDVVEQLSERIEVAARAELAERLAPIPNAPPRTIRKLAFDREIAVAAPVLTQSPRLSDNDLVENAKTMGKGHLMAISRRQSVSEAVTDVLVVRGDREVAYTIAGNAGAKFSTQGFSALVARSAGDDALCERVGLRPDVPRHLYLQLLAEASGVVRKKLQKGNPLVLPEIQQAIASVADRMATTAASTSRSFDAARSAVEWRHAAGILDENDLREFALAGKFEETTIALSKLCWIPLSFAERAILQARPETVLILVKAAGHSWLTAKALLALRAQSCGIISDDLDECMVSFECLKRSTAEKVLQLCS